MIVNLSNAVHVLPMRTLTTLSVDKILLPSYMNWSINFRRFKKAGSRRYPVKTVSDTNYVDELALIENTPSQVEFLQHTLEQAASGTGLHINSNKIENGNFHMVVNLSMLYL